MPFTFSCPECEKSLRSANPIAPGKKVKCPGCGVLFSPHTDEDIEKEDRPKRRPRDEEGEEDRPRRRRSRDEEQDEEGDAPARSRRSRLDDYEDEEDDRPRRKKSKSKKSGANLPLILGISGGSVAVLVLLVLAAFVWPGFMRSSGTKGDHAGTNPKGGGPGPQAAKAKEPDPGLVVQLAPPIQVEKYEIRLPKGFVSAEPPKR